MVEPSNESTTMRQFFYRARSADALATAVQSLRTASKRTQGELAAAIGSSCPTRTRSPRRGSARLGLGVVVLG